MKCFGILEGYSAERPPVDSTVLGEHTMESSRDRCDCFRVVRQQAVHNPIRVEHGNPALGQPTQGGTLPGSDSAGDADDIVHTQAGILAQRRSLVTGSPDARICPMISRTHRFPDYFPVTGLRATVLGFGVVLVAIGSPAYAHAQRESRVSVSIDTPAVTVGDTVRASVIVEGVTDLAGYQLTLVWDTDFLRDSEIRVDEEFITSSGRRIEYLEPVWGEDRVTFLLFTTPPGPGSVPGVDGDGVLIFADFEALAPGETMIELDEALLTDSENSPIEALIIPGSVTIGDSSPIFMPITYGG